MSLTGHNVVGAMVGVLDGARDGAIDLVGGLDGVGEGGLEGRCESVSLGCTDGIPEGNRDAISEGVGGGGLEGTCEGVSLGCTNGMTFKILTDDTNEVIYRSEIRQLYSTAALSRVPVPGTGRETYTSTPSTSNLITTSAFFLLLAGKSKLARKTSSP
jgi:hypothetical protein